MKESKAQCTCIILFERLYLCYCRWSKIATSVWFWLVLIRIGSENKGSGWSRGLAVPMPNTVENLSKNDVGCSNNASSREECSIALTGGSPDKRLAGLTSRVADDPDSFREPCEPARINPTARNLLQLAKEAPNLQIFSWYNDGRATASWGAQETLFQAQGVANALLSRWGIESGDAIILCYSPGLEFVRAFLGCLLVGVIPVPIAPLDPRHPEKVRVVRGTPVYANLEHIACS